MYNIRTYGLFLNVQHMNILQHMNIWIVFKCTIYEHMDWEERKIELLFENWPVAMVGDGSSVNK